MNSQGWTRAFIFLACAVLGGGSPAFPQAVANGSLEGAVTDSAGLALPGVTVSISGPAIVGDRTATTDVNGTYQFPTLPAGTYTLTCELLGYEAVHREGILITAGQASTLALGLGGRRARAGAAAPRPTRGRPRSTRRSRPRRSPSPTTSSTTSPAPPTCGRPWT